VLENGNVRDRHQAHVGGRQDRRQLGLGNAVENLQLAQAEPVALGDQRRLLFALAKKHKEQRLVVAEVLGGPNDDTQPVDPAHRAGVQKNHAALPAPLASDRSAGDVRPEELDIGAVWNGLDPLRRR